MSVTTPLTEFAAAEATRVQAAAAAARQALAELDARLPGLRAAAAAAIADAAAIRRAETQLRGELAVAPLPADADKLVEQLEDNLIQQQAACRKVEETADALAAAEADRAGLTGRLPRLGSLAADAVAAAARAQDTADRVAAWRTAVRGAEIGAALGVAATALTKPPYTGARDRLVRLLDQEQPDGLLELLRGRAADADAEAEAAAERSARADAARHTSEDAAEAAHEALVERVRMLAQDAAQQVRAAVARLTEIAVSPGRNDPNDEEQGRLDGYRDAALQAAAKEGALLAARAALRGAAATLDAKALELIAADPDVDIGTATASQAERAAVTEAEKSVAVTAAEYAAVRTDLATWEVAVPAGLRAEVADFLMAETTLRGLAAVEVDTLLADLDDAETKLAAALRAASTRVRSLRRLDAERDRRRTELAAAASAAHRRWVAAVRGER